MKIRAVRELSSKKFLGIFQTISKSTVTFHPYSCKFDFKKQAVIILENNSIHSIGQLISKGSKFSKIKNIYIHNTKISIEKDSTSLLIPERKMNIISESITSISNISAGNTKYSLGEYGTIDIDYMTRWMDCILNKNLACEAMTIASFIFLFNCENRVTDG